MNTQVIQSCVVSPFGAVQASANNTTTGVDSVAEGFIGRPQFSPDVATVESEESRRGVRYFGPGDNMTPALPNLGNW